MRGDGYQRDTVIIAEGTADYVADMSTDVRSIPCKVIDDTPGARVLGQAMKEAPFRPNGRWQSGEVRARCPFHTHRGQVDAMILINPTYVSTRDQSKKDGLQTLRRFVALSHCYPFPETNPEDEPQLRAECLKIRIQRLDEHGGRFETISFGEGCRKSNFGFLCKGPDTHEPGDALAEFLTRKNGDREWLEAQYQEARFADDGDSPSSKLLEKLREGRHINVKGWRDCPPNLRIRLAAGRPLQMEVARQIGEVQERHLHSSRLATYARRIVSERSDEKLAGYLTRLADFQQGQATALMNRVGRTPLPARGDDDDEFFNALRVFYRDGVEDDGRPPLPDGVPDDAAPYKATVVAPLLAVAPNAAYDRLVLGVPLLERLSREQSGQTQKLLRTLEAKLIEHRRAGDAGTATHYVGAVFQHLATLGLTLEAASGEAELPALEDAAVKKMGRLAVPVDAARQEDVSGPEWSKARAHLASAGAPLAANRRAVDDFTNQDALERDIPVDWTRAGALRGLVPHMSALELGVMLVIMRIPFTPNNIAHLADMGIQLFNAHATRFAEMQRVSSIITMKRGGATIRTIISPLLAAMSSRGLAGETDLSFVIATGSQWVDGQNVGEIFGAFPEAVIGGFNTRWCRDLGTFVKYMTGDGMHPDDTDALIFIPFSIEETRHQYPLFSLHTPPLELFNGTVPSYRDHLCSGYVVLRDLLMQSEAVEGAIGALETVRASCSSSLSYSCRPSTRSLCRAGPCASARTRSAARASTLTTSRAALTIPWAARARAAPSL